jgi:FkbM family methyltransferase
MKDGASWKGVPSAVARSWRSWSYTLLTYLGSERLRSAGRRRAGQTAIRVAQAAVARGSITVRGGAGFGLRLSTDYLPIDHIQGFGLVRGVLEPEVQEALRRTVSSGAVVYDVGANVGFFSLLSAKLAGPGGRVEAFEPVPHNAAAIRANAALNGLETIRVHQVAVSDHDGTGQVCIPVEASWAHLMDRGQHPATEKVISVQLTVLDDQIGAGLLPRPDVVKIDVEGFELQVLNGLRQTLANHPVTVICELHGTNPEMLEMMSALGYSVINLEGVGPIQDAGPVHVLMQPERRT